MSYQATTATRRVLHLNKRIRAIQGGTSASKTVSILLVLINAAQSDKTPTLTSIVSESFPHLRRGVMRDFILIMQVQGYFSDSRWDKTNSIYTFETGSQIEFFSVDQSEKVRGARRDRLFINECNNVSFAAFEELEVRTKECVYLDWNPVAQFWVYDHVINRPDCEHIILTYRDNEALDAAIVATIEQRKNRAGWWKVYGEGQLGEVEGKIYRDWVLDLEAVPHKARLERHAVDFGYSNDPTAIVDIYYFNGGYILDELAYQKEMSNKQIADVILNQRKALTVADSAEPKSIAEIRDFGITILPAEKGKDSVAHGIQVVQDQQISVTKRSVNIIKEYRNYLWETDKDGRILNVPEHTWSHSMDAIRYGLTSLVPMIKRKEFIESMPRGPQKAKVNPAR